MLFHFLLAEPILKIFKSDHLHINQHWCTEHLFPGMCFWLISPSVFASPWLLTPKNHASEYRKWTLVTKKVFSTQTRLCISVGWCPEQESRVFFRFVQVCWSWTTINFLRWYSSWHRSIVRDIDHKMIEKTFKSENRVLPVPWESSEGIWRLLLPKTPRDRFRITISVVRQNKLANRFFAVLQR